MPLGSRTALRNKHVCTHACTHLNPRIFIQMVAEHTGLKLVALVQSRQSSNDDDGEMSVPAAAIHQSHSYDIIGVLSDLLDKAHAELDNTRDAVTNTAHNFTMLKQCDGDQLAPANKALEKDMSDKSRLANALAALTAEKADPAEAQESLASFKASQAAIKSSCGQVASDHEFSVKGFAEKLSALADAAHVIQGETGGAKEWKYLLVQQRSVSGVQTFVDVPVVMQRQVSHVQFIDKIVDIPGVAQRQTPMVQKSQKTIETPQVQHINKVVDVPAVQVVQTAQKTVEIPVDVHIPRTCTERLP